MKYELPQLPYGYSALEPYLDAATMEVHHSKHHAGYVAKLNAALEQAPAIADVPLETLLASPDRIPEAIRTAVVNNGGGHLNHSVFWETLGAAPEKKPEGKLLEAIETAFSSFEEMKRQFTETALGVFGSGWAWLVKTRNGTLAIVKTANQDTPIREGATPLLNADVWEHAYYLKYQNRRQEYIEAWWNVVNWNEVARRFAD